ncbi:MAG: anti-phage defense ZorAB system ZorA [Selenomonadaceae bacterium]|nr:anti-phage defense ZorAB system ZorA [Selenomonadaceae bacterium]
MNTWIISGVFIFMLAFAAVYYWFNCRRRILAINDEVERVLKAKDIAAALTESKSLAPVWRGFEQTLTKTQERAYSTTDAAEFFTPQALTRDMNMTFWQSYGGIFTGLGILGTFAGLTVGLSGVDMTSGNIEVLKDGIKNLLSGVESAFVTSLVGIGGAIVYSVIHHLLIKKFQGNVQALASKLDEIYPRRSIEDWLKDNYTESKEQTTALKNIGEDVSRAISDAFDEKLEMYVENICKAIDKLGSGGTDTIGEIFTKGVGAQMERFSAALDRFSDSIDEKLKASDEISKIMNEQLLQTLNDLNEALKQDRAERDKKDKENSQHHREINESFETLVKNLLADLKDFTERQKEFLGRVANTNTAQISEAVEAFREIVNRHNQTTQKTFAQVQKLLDETEKYLQLMDDASTSLKQAAEPVKESTRQLANNLLETSAQMKNLSTANQQTRQNLFDLSARLREFVTNFNGIANELERSTTIISDSLEHYNFEMSKGLSDALTKFDSTVGKAALQLNEIMEELTDAIEDLRRNRR